MKATEKRINELLLYLSRQREFQSSETIANYFAVSEKTIYRMIKQINDTNPDEKMIKSQKGRGYKLDYEIFISQTIHDENNSTNISPVERRNNVMQELLLYAPKSISINRLFEKYYISDAVINNDEKIISDILEKFNLKYIRKNREAKIIGNEPDIRYAIAKLMNTAGFLDLEEIKRNTDFNLDNYDANFILEQLNHIERRLNIEIPYPYNVNIFSHLYIMIGRIKKSGKVLDIDQSFTSDSIKKEFELNHSIYLIAKFVIDNISKYLRIELPITEEYYLFQYLLSSRIITESKEKLYVNPFVQEITKMYIEEVGKQFGINQQSAELMVLLSQHIKPMLNRLQNNIYIKNTLIEAIKLEYADVFESVCQASKIICKQFNLDEINEDENGFITLYFARVMEQNPKKIKTLIMCTTGIGTSELLKVKVQKKFPELEIVAIIASKNLNNVLKQYPDIELILTTINLNQNISIPTILVSAMFTLMDQERVQKKIGELL